jgi:hypothetical protein
MRPVNVVDVQPALAREGWKIHAMLMLPGLTAQGRRGALGWPAVPWLALVRLCWAGAVAAGRAAPAVAVSGHSFAGELDQSRDLV